MIEVLSNKRSLVVVAHPDDELLGVGGTAHKLAKDHGCSVRAVILGEGITSRSDKRDPEQWKAELEKHRANIDTAAACIGYESVGIYDFPDNRFDSVDRLDLIKVVEKEKKDFKPSVVLTHFGGDTNIDHRATFDAVITACRPLEGEIVNTILAFETPSSTEWQASNHPYQFTPNVFIPLSSDNVDAKIKGMESYGFEKRPFPHPRSPEALRNRAQYWGSVVGKSFAEPFMLIRNVAS